MADHHRESTLIKYFSKPHGPTKRDLLPWRDSREVWSEEGQRVNAVVQKDANTVLHERSFFWKGLLVFRKLGPEFATLSSPPSSAQQPPFPFSSQPGLSEWEGSGFLNQLFPREASCSSEETYQPAATKTSPLRRRLGHVGAPSEQDSHGLKLPTLPPHRHLAQRLFCVTQQTVHSAGKGTR